MTQHRSGRPNPDDRETPRRRAVPEPQALRLPNGWYDPDSAAFDERMPTDIDELFHSTQPAEPATALRPVAS
jgi:hypothetical protein